MTGTRGNRLIEVRRPAKVFFALSNIAFVSYLILTPVLVNASACDDRKSELLQKLSTYTLLRMPIEQNYFGPGIREKWMDEMRKRHVQLAHVSFDFAFDMAGTDKVTAVWVQYFSDIRGAKEVAISDKELDWLLTAAAHQGLVRGLQSVMKRLRWRMVSGRVLLSIYEDECISGGYGKFTLRKFEPAN